jgi:hypothetical protein
MVGRATRRGRQRRQEGLLAELRTQAADLYKIAPDDPKTKRLMTHARYTSKLANLRAMIEMAKSEPGMTARLSDFDSDLPI